MRSHHSLKKDLMSWDPDSRSRSSPRNLQISSVTSLNSYFCHHLVTTCRLAVFQDSASSMRRERSLCGPLSGWVVSTASGATAVILPSPLALGRLRPSTTRQLESNNTSVTPPSLQEQITDTLLVGCWLAAHLHLQ